MQVVSESSPRAVTLSDRISVIYKTHGSLEDSLANLDAVVLAVKKGDSTAWDFNLSDSLMESIEKCKADAVACLRLFSPNRSLDGKYKGLVTVEALYATRAGPAARIKQFLTLVERKMGNRLPPSVVLVGCRALGRVDPAYAAELLGAYVGATISSFEEFCGGEGVEHQVSLCVYGNKESLRGSVVSLMSLRAECMAMAARDDLVTQAADQLAVILPLILTTKEVVQLALYEHLCATEGAKARPVHHQAPTPLPPSARVPKTSTSRNIRVEDAEADPLEKNDSQPSFFSKVFDSSLHASGWRLQVTRLAVGLLVSLLLRILVPKLWSAAHRVGSAAHSASVNRRVLTL